MVSHHLLTVLLLAILRFSFLYCLWGLPWSQQVVRNNKKSSDRPPSDDKLHSCRHSWPTSLIMKLQRRLGHRLHHQRGRRQARTLWLLELLHRVSTSFPWIWCRKLTSSSLGSRETKTGRPTEQTGLWKTTSLSYITLTRKTQTQTRLAVNNAYCCQGRTFQRVDQTRQLLQVQRPP